jgi:hypothetical protein
MLISGRLRRRPRRRMVSWSNASAFVRHGRSQRTPKGQTPLLRVLCRFMQKENRVRSTQASLENVKCEPGSTVIFRRRWSSQQNFRRRRKRQS